MDRIEALKRLWLDKRVISISNEFQVNPSDTSIDTGTVTDVIPITKSSNPVPVVLFDGDTEPKVCFSTIIEYDSDLYASLNKLTAKERWDLIQAFVFRFHE